MNCQFEELDESNFKVKYESSKQKGTNLTVGQYSITSINTPIGKNVFKKSVKLMISVVPTQTNNSSQATPSLPLASTTTTTPATTDVGDAIIFDGKTFTVSFTQISGK